MTVSFEIVDQTHEWIYQTNGTRTGQWIITFKAPSGVLSQVIVDDATYAHTTHVANLIASEVVKIEQNQALTEGDETAHPVQGRAAR